MLTFPMVLWPDDGTMSRENRRVLDKLNAAKWQLIDDTGLDCDEPGDEEALAELTALLSQWYQTHERPAEIDETYLQNLSSRLASGNRS